MFRKLMPWGLLRFISKLSPLKKILVTSFALCLIAYGFTSNSSKEKSAASSIKIDLNEIKRATVLEENTPIKEKTAPLPAKAHLKVKKISKILNLEIYQMLLKKQNQIIKKQRVFQNRYWLNLK